jgi:hypothetical protein
MNCVRCRRAFPLIGALLVGAAVTSLPVVAQDVAPPPADPADVATQDAIIAAVYDVISGPAGQARDWDRWRTLFLPDARLVAVRVTRDGEVSPVVMTPEEYVQRSGDVLEANGFFEVEIDRTAERYGHIAHMFSTYESRRSLDDPEPFARGINSFQLMWDGERWWVLTIFWDSERPDQPIPARYGG